jgi:PmbA protein
MDRPDHAHRLHEAAAAARTELENCSAQRWELFAKSSFTREVEIRPGRPRSTCEVDETGVSVRSWRNGRAGFAAASGFGPTASRRAVEAALESECPLSRDPLPHINQLGHSEVPPPRKLPATGWATHVASELDGAVSSVGGGTLRLTRTIVQEGVYGWILANSDEWVARHEDSNTSVLIEVAMSGNRLGVWREWFHVPAWEHFDTEDAAEQIANRALLTSTQVVTDSGIKDLIFHPEVASQLLAALGPLFVARDVEDDPIPQLVDRNGRLAAPALTVVDDRCDLTAPLTGPCDGEGLPSRRTLLLEQGVPRYRLASIRDAALFGDAPRGGAVRLSYRDYPATGIGNLKVDTTEGVGSGELLMKAERALYLLRPIAPVVCEIDSDSYRIVASGVWLDGARLRGWHPVVELRGQLGRLLRSIEAVGNDLRWFQTGGGFIGSPSLLVRRQPVVG